MGGRRKTCIQGREERSEHSFPESPESGYVDLSKNCVFIRLRKSFFSIDTCHPDLAYSIIPHGNFLKNNQFNQQEVSHLEM